MPACTTSRICTAATARSSTVSWSKAGSALQDGDRLKICDLSLAFYNNEPSDRLPGGIDLSGSSLAVMVDDAGAMGTSTVMSKLDVSSSRSGVRLAVNPEVKLRAMIEISHNLAKAVSLDEVLVKLLDSLFKIFIQADRGFVILRTGPEGVLVPQGRETSPAGHGRPGAHQPHDRPASDGKPGGRAVGRRRQRFAIRHQPKHRRLAHPLDDRARRWSTARATRWA